MEDESNIETTSKNETLGQVEPASIANSWKTQDEQINATYLESSEVVEHNASVVSEEKTLEEQIVDGNENTDFSSESSMENVDKTTSSDIKEDVTIDESIRQFLINEGLAEVKDDKLIITKAPRKSIVPTIILFVALAFVIGISVYQAMYIWRFSSGEFEKPTSYVVEDDEEEDDDKNDDSLKEEVSSAINPAFSLEEAAAVHDPNKKTLSITEIYNKVYPATVTIYIKAEDQGREVILGAGSGFIITEDGYIVTNEHVVEGATAGIEVIVPFSEESFSAELVGKDVQTDIAVIKIESEEPLPTVVLGESSKLQNGELAVAIGCPLGNFEGSITAGVVSGVERPMNNNGYSLSLIQTDASVNSGNSGGALINSFGEVIGVVNAKIATAEGLGFAIPIDSVKGVIESIIVNGKVIDRPYLGVTVMYISPDSYFGAEEGVFVKEFVKDGPGDQAGIQVGDKILSMDGVAINASNDIIIVRDSHRCGDAISVIVERDGTKVELTLVIGDSADYNDD